MSQYKKEFIVWGMLFFIYFNISNLYLNRIFDFQYLPSIFCSAKVL